jgi:hypothetical protein
MYDLSIPVVLNEILELFTVGGFWVGDVVVGEPAVKLGLMPLIVDWFAC